MCKKIRILISNVTSPWFNLATEDWIFNELTADTQILFLCLEFVELLGFVGL